MAEITMENVELVFRAVAPRTDSNPVAIQDLEDAFCLIAQKILATVPRCADRSAALRDLRIVKMMCVEAVAKGGLI